MTFKIEKLDLDGQGVKRHRVFEMPSVSKENYWISVTDVFCPCESKGVVRWAENGYVPGYRICDVCRRHFLARGNAMNPKLVLFGNRRG